MPRRLDCGSHSATPMTPPGERYVARAAPSQSSLGSWSRRRAEERKSGRAEERLRLGGVGHGWLLQENEHACLLRGLSGSGHSQWRRLGSGMYTASMGWIVQNGWDPVSTRAATAPVWHSRWACKT